MADNTKIEWTDASWNPILWPVKNCTFGLLNAKGMAYSRPGDKAWRVSNPLIFLADPENQHGVVACVRTSANDPNGKAFPHGAEAMECFVWIKQSGCWARCAAPASLPAFTWLEMLEGETNG